MQVPVHGSSALKLERQASVKKNVKTVKRTRKVSAAAKRKSAFTNFLCIIAITAMAFCMLYRYAQITEKSSQVALLKNELEEAESAIVQKQFELERSVDLKTIESVAISRLGMQTPDKQQIVYIDMKNEDFVEVDEKPVISGVFGSIISSITKLVEYLH